MSLPHLTIIGERINPGFASSKALLDAEDLPALQALAVSPDGTGIGYSTNEGLVFNASISGTMKCGFSFLITSRKAFASVMSSL